MQQPYQRIQVGFCHKKILKYSWFYDGFKLDTIVKSHTPRSLPRGGGIAEGGKAVIQSSKELMDDLDPGFRRGDDFFEAY